jgi:FKBP-type peptidyl-prolyl cis-trans isomerase
LEEAGRAMLQQMSETEGVYILDSGVILHPLEAEDGFGTGARPTAASSVKVHYHGTLPDGTVFYSSLGREPVTFALAQVIPGWKDALLNMHEGETAMIGIPAEMAYSDMGSPDGRIPGGAVLFFKVQLLEVLSAGIGGQAQLLGPDGNPY